MKTFKKILLGLLAFIVVVLIVGFFLPRKTHVERSAEISASPEVVYDQVNNLKNWVTWSPWHHLDPKMKMEYFGPESGQLGRNVRGGASAAAVEEAGDRAVFEHLTDRLRQQRCDREHGQLVELLLGGDRQAVGHDHLADPTVLQAVDRGC